MTAVLDRTDLPAPHRRFAGKAFMHHNRLAAGVLVANAATVAVIEPGAGTFAELSLANVALAVLIRQQYVINALFRLATSAPVSWPLAIRWHLAKVYHFGGLHVGAALAATAWFGAFVATLAMDQGHPVTLTASSAILILLVTLLATARPSFRARRHDLFERAHRFGGWAALGLLWVQTAAYAVETGATPYGTVATLAVLTASVALPWVRLRRVRVRIERPSNHVALVRFDNGVTPFAGSSTAVSRSPLREWHSFANVPAPGQHGFRLTISRAGDWTARFIDDAPTHVWVKGIPTAGVANIETLFRRVVYVATGSGIGPVLPHLLAGAVPAHLVWATRDPRVTYGDALVDEILAVQPGAEIWDTSRDGKPDLVRLAWAAVRATGAEAVICIANRKLTWEVVTGLESRGVPAYGAIWDS